MYARHLRCTGGARPRRIQNFPTSDPLSRFQRDAFNPRAGRILGHRNHLVRDVFHPAFARLPLPPIKDCRAIPIPFINKVNRAQDDIIDIVKRVVLQNLVCGHQLSGCTGRILYLLILTQNLRKVFVVSQIHIPKGPDG